MPDHLHALIEGQSDDADFRRWAAAFRKWATLAGRAHGIDALWQDGFHERVLRPGDDPRLVARYLLLNPVRAGLVDEPHDYPWSWSAFDDFSGIDK